jgi:putative pyruvate formate lyase activating enzyme
MKEPTYIQLHRSGELKRRANFLKELYRECILCPNACLVNRTKDERGRCRSGSRPVVAAVVRHMGEEPPLSAKGGIGNVFFAGCNLHCVYCQNYRISQGDFPSKANERTEQELANIFIDLFQQGSPAIGLVTPTHFLPSIVEAIDIAASRGLSIPIVYNTSSYESVEIIRLLEGIVDIYLADLRYASDEYASIYSMANGYVKVAREAIIEMYRQVGNLKKDSNGLAYRGLIVRLLVLPENAGGCKESLIWLKNSLDTEVHISIMAQYYPTYMVSIESMYSPLNRHITEEEYMEVVSFAEKLGFQNGWIQDLDSHYSWRPEEFL